VGTGRRLWSRVGGAGGVVFFVSLAVLIVLMPLSHSVSEPAFDAPSNAFLAYAKSESNLPAALELAGVLGLFGFVVFAGVLAEKLRRHDEAWNVPSVLVLLATAVFTASWLALFGLRFANRFRHADLDASGAGVLYGLSNGVFVSSWAAIGGFLIASGVASLWSRAFPAWLGWAAIVIGIAMVLSVASPLSAVWFFPYFLFFFWVLAASVVLLIGEART